MLSRCGSALLPNSLTISPFTDTRPWVINSSAWRREAMPAAAMIFCSRSCGIAHLVSMLNGSQTDDCKGREFHTKARKAHEVHKGPDLRVLRGPSVSFV